MFGSAYGVLVLGSVFVLFLDELGLPKERIGLLSGLIFLPGPIALFIAPYLARLGFKRSLILFYGGRKFVAAALLLTPAVFSTWGPAASFFFASGVMLAYGVLRVIAETAFYPWLQEYVPNSVRGQYMATCSIVGPLVGMLAVAWSGHVMDAGSGFGRYQLVMGVGCILGFIGVLLKLPIPGGAPEAVRTDQRTHFRQMKAAVDDRAFRRFLLGLGILGLATGGWSTFVPLYLKETIGLDAGDVVGLHKWTLTGTLLSSYVWGFAADTKGSKPVLMAGLILMVLAPLGWMALPQLGGDGNTWAALLAGLSGVAMMGYSIGHERLLFVSAVPPEQKTEYMAVFYAVTQILMTLSPYLAGEVLVASQGLSGTVRGFAIDEYTPFFAGSMCLIIAGLWVFGGVRDSSQEAG